MKHKIAIAFLIISVVLISFFVKDHASLTVALVSVIVAFVLLLTYGVFNIRFNYFLNSVNNGLKPGVALTFDDGPDPEITPQILDVLDEFNVKGTFFVIGEKVERHPEVVKMIDQRGHVVGNHSFKHTKTLPFSWTRGLVEDFKKCSDAIESCIDKTPKLFRPPFGITTPRYSRALKRLGLNSIGWSIRSLDTMHTSKENLMRRLTKKSIGSDIVLLHDTQKVTLEVLPDFIKNCQNNGTEIAPLPELIDCKPYE